MKWLHRLGVIAGMCGIAMVVSIGIAVLLHPRDIIADDTFATPMPTEVRATATPPPTTPAHAEVTNVPTTLTPPLPARTTAIPALMPVP
ncbi:MAG: hypothetical protein GFH27_549285n151 [Chloroflexi bacterium AL-W]|nr:hypothetical protein [Chloroflexi bacterium AL-N1]NOK65663.1 hypothetical protein [Chloroflexi bacterium AL-N10]NOK74396.1 hypothetical protein [Chloroflexi bacterium AL-N5]NOK80696.1 hypothetical protein [Chloroflexi bacterium AL-W]NOK88654.1 hypothetical protein [Chloroflexi bacterium AL-N15]